MVRRLTIKGTWSLLALMMASQFLYILRHVPYRHQRSSLVAPSDIRQGTLDGEDITQMHAFSWDEVDLNAVEGCGWIKCFFRSAFNSSVGYTIGYEHRDWGSDKEGVGLFQQLKEGWKVSRELERKVPYYVRTGLLRPPEIVSIPSKEVLSSLRLAVEKAARGQPMGYFTRLDSISLIRNQSKADNMIVVQKTETFPSLHLVLSCPLSSMIDVSRLQSFSKEIGNFEDFDERFKGEMKVLNEVMKAEPRLWSDFQILLDRHGNFYYHDLDRTIGELSPLKRMFLAKNTCLDYLVEVKNILIAGGTTLPRSRVLTRLLEIMGVWPM